MKKVTSIFSVVAALCAVGFALPAHAVHTQYYTKPYQNYYRQVAPSGFLPGDLIDDVLTALSEENRAATRYSKLAEHFGHTEPFARVAREKRQHVDELRDLLARYGVTPTPSPFVNVQIPYDIAQACYESAKNEARLVTDVYNILLNKSQVLNQSDVKALLEKLRTDARNDHQPAFEGCHHNRYGSGHDPYHGGHYVPPVKKPAAKYVKPKKHYSPYTASVYPRYHKWPNRYWHGSTRAYRYPRSMPSYRGGYNGYKWPNRYWWY